MKIQIFIILLVSLSIFKGDHLNKQQYSACMIQLLRENRYYPSKLRVWLFGREDAFVHIDETISFSRCLKYVDIENWLDSSHSDYENFDWKSIKNVPSGYIGLEELERRGYFNSPKYQAFMSDTIRNLQFIVYRNAKRREFLIALTKISSNSRKLINYKEVFIWPTWAGGIYHQWRKNSVSEVLEVDCN